jgi:hypothetical protein
MAEEAGNSSGTTPRWLPRNVRSRGGASGLATFYLLISATFGALAATTDDVLLRWLWLAVCLGNVALSATYWFAARHIPKSRRRSEA